MVPGRYSCTARGVRTRPASHRHSIDTPSAETPWRSPGSNFDSFPSATVERDMRDLIDFANCSSSISRLICFAGSMRCTRKSSKREWPEVRSARCCRPAGIPKRDGIGTPSCVLLLIKKTRSLRATSPEAPVRRCSDFSSQGRGDRQPAFGAPPSHVLGSGTGTRSDQENREFSKRRGNRRIQPLIGYLRGSGIGSWPQTRQREPKNPARAHSSHRSSRCRAISSRSNW